MQMTTVLSRKDKNRAELLCSLASAHKKIVDLKKALKYTKDSCSILEGELADVESSQKQTLEKLEPMQEKLDKLRGEAAGILDATENSVRAELEQTYAKKLSMLEIRILDRKMYLDW